MLSLSIVIIVLVLLYKLGTINFTYWEKKGVKYDKPLPFVGNTLDQLLKKRSIGDIIAEVYRRYPGERFVGMFHTTRRVLVVRDPDLAKQILLTDFKHFYRRGINSHKTVVEPMMRHLFTADGDLWKLIRQRLTPVFSTKKLKLMFPLIVDVAEKLQTVGAKLADECSEVDVKDLMARYTTDFIAVCGFGLDPDTLNDENCMFRVLGKRLFDTTTKDILKITAKSLAPELFKNVRYGSPELYTMAYSLVNGILEQRKHKPIGRNDYIDFLLELKQQGKIVGDSIEKTKADGTPETVEIDFDDDIVMAQVMLFFGAGFETSSTLSSSTLHQLALHPDAQEKCQEEIDRVLNRHGNKLCYEAVLEMKYLEMCTYEASRVFPGFTYLVRECSKPYIIPDTNVTIDEGVVVYIPVKGMQHDEKYFAHANQFIPERFGPDRIQEVNHFVFYPFGAGPRACIGERMGLLQTLAGIAAVLSKFRVVPSVNTARNLVAQPSSFLVQNIQGAVPLKLIRR